MMHRKVSGWLEFLCAVIHDWSSLRFIGLLQRDNAFHVILPPFHV